MPPDRLYGNARSISAALWLVSVSVAFGVGSGAVSVATGRALQGDGTLSGIGAATSLLAIAALAVYDTLGWWWADRTAALIVAAIAAAEAWHTAPRRKDQ